jgi:nucleoid-associated protein YgaU
MALNVKMALGVCLVCISGITWLLDTVSGPVASIPSPLVSEEQAPRSEWLYAGVQTLEPEPATALVAVSPVTTALAAAREESRELQRQQASVVLAVPEDLPAQLPESSDHDVVLAADSSVLRDPANMQRVHDMPDEQPNHAARSERDWLVHRVAAGDSLARIARVYWGQATSQAIDRLVRANPHLQGRRHNIQVGEEIRVPQAQPQPRSAPFATAVNHNGGADAAGTAASGSREVESLQWYTIRRRDSLSSIARRLLNDERRWVEIKQLNGIKDADVIRPGMRIKLPQPFVSAGA